MQINLSNLIDEAQCYDTVRELRWPEGRECPFCDSKKVIRKGSQNNRFEMQRYQCKSCNKKFDDLTNTIFSGHHQPLKVWILTLYLMGLNLSNEQIAKELDLNKDDVHKMTTQLREGIVKKSPKSS